MRDFYIGLDNGCSGTGCVLDRNGKIMEWFKAPSFDYTEYNKTKLRTIKRMNRNELKKLLQLYADRNTFVLMEQPYQNPKGFLNSMSAARSYEVTLGVIEELKLPHQVIDSGVWQDVLLPAGCKGIQLKKASRDVAKKLFPEFVIPAGEDGDGILLAEFARRNNL